MKDNPYKYHRESIRLNGYDYSSIGAYFITICTRVRGNVLGEVIDGKMMLNELGKVVENEWLKSFVIRKEIKLDEFIIMSDHMHGIIIINDNNACNCRGAPVERPSKHRVAHRPTPTLKPNTIGSIINQFKSNVTKRINKLGHYEFSWQRNYYDEIIRNEKQLNEIRKYIINNPIAWENENSINYKIL